MEEQAKYEIAEQVPSFDLSIEDVKTYIAPTATDKELFVFMNTAKSYGLNPFKREIHFIKYGTAPGKTIVGYETYIKRAEKTGLLDGWKVDLDKDAIGQKAIITIFRKDRKNPFVWSVYRQEFDTGQANWKSMPLFMLRKVAISQGFRLAFPEEIGGMPYIPEEINGGKSEELQADVIDAQEDPAPQPELKRDRPLTAKQGKRILEIGLNRHQLTDAETKRVIDWYCAEHGRTFESGEKLQEDFDAIFEAFVESEAGSVPVQKEE